MIRIVPAVLGGALLIRGLGRRSLRGSATALVGGWVLLRTLGGTDRIKGVIQSRTPTESRNDERTTGAIEVRRSILVGKPADELYEAWLDPDRLSTIMGHFAEVTSPDEDRFRWTVRGPRGREFSWETRIVDAKPGEYVRWESSEGATVSNEGTVRFRPAAGDRGTKVTLTISFDPPGGALGNAVLNRLELAPETLAGTSLRRFKSLVESGEIPTLEGNPSARGSGDLL